MKKEPLRRGQIFKKQMESSENLHRIQSIKNIQKIIMTKEEKSAVEAPKIVEEAVKIENQLSPTKETIQKIPQKTGDLRTTATDTGSVRKNINADS